MFSVLNSHFSTEPEVSVPPFLANTAANTHITNAVSAKMSMQTRTSIHPLLSAILPSIGWKVPKSEQEIATSNDVDGDGIPDLAKPQLLKSVPFGPAIAVGASVAVAALLVL